MELEEIIVRKAFLLPIAAALVGASFFVSTIPAGAQDGDSGMKIDMPGQTGSQQSTPGMGGMNGMDGGMPQMQSQSLI